MITEAEDVLAVLRPIIGRCIEPASQWLQIEDGSHCRTVDRYSCPVVALMGPNTDFRRRPQSAFQAPAPLW